MKKNLLVVKVIIALLIFAGVFTLAIVGTSCFAAETPEVVETTIVATTTTQTTDTQQAVATVEKFIDWCKNLSMADVKACIIGVISYISANGLIILGLLIKILLSKSKEVRTSKEYQEAIAKLNAENQKQVKDLEEKHDKKLQDLHDDIINYIKKQNSEKRKLAQDTVDTMKEKIGEIQIELDK